MKVLMIGPGNANELTSGLGVAANQIGNELSKKAEILLIQPSEEDEMVDQAHHKHYYFLPFNRFSEATVIDDITRIAVRGSVSPYFYAYMEPTVMEEKVDSSVRIELEKFTDSVVGVSESYDFDVIYAHDWVTFEAATKIKSITGKPLVLHAHSLDIDRISSQHHSWIYDVEKKAFEIADAIIAVSNYSKTRISEHYNISEEKIHVAYNGSNHLPMGSKKTRFQDPVVLFVGRLSSQKGPQVFIEIADKILEKQPDVRFIMVGSGDMRNDLLELSAHKKIGDRIFFTGFVDPLKLAELLHEASVFCMPSVSDPYGLAALEAASFSVPVVLSKQTGAKEVLPGALLADHWDVEGFARHALSLLDEKNREMAVRQNLQAIRSISWESSGNQVYEVLKKQL